MKREISEDDPFALHNAIEREGSAPVILKDWSASQFSNVYIKYRPILEGHAKRFLSEPTQVDDVVQDAFLYLMTALPELDSEVGVLRFLKWKVRLLSLDILRAEGRAFGVSLDSIDEPMSSDPDLSEDLQRADDAAIVTLALSRLNERHRRALLSILVEEKTSNQVARELGLNENAFRQLLYRAKSAFKDSLLAELKAAGMTLHDLTSVALGRLTKGSAGRTMSLLALAALLGVGIVLPILPSDSNTLIAEISPRSVNQVKQAPFPATEPLESTNNGNRGPIATDVPSMEALSSSNLEAPQTDIIESNGTSPILQADEISPTRPYSDMEVELVDYVRSKSSSLLSSSIEEFTTDPQSIRVQSDDGFISYISFDLSTQNVVQYAYFSVEEDGIQVLLTPKTSTSVVERLDDVTRVHYAATDFLVGDISGSFNYTSTDSTSLLRIGLAIYIEIDTAGNVTHAGMSAKGLSGGEPAVGLSQTLEEN